MLREKIYEELKEAMKAREKLKLEALRYLWSLIKNEEIEVKADLTDDQVMKVVASEVKKRKEALEQIKTSKRVELIQAEEEKLKVLEAFLPEQMSREEIEKVVTEVVSQGMNDFGVVMGQVMGKVRGKADGKLVSEVVREKLGKFQH